MHKRIDNFCQSQNSSLFTQEDWCEAIQSVGYTVKQIDQNDIYDYRGLSNCFAWRNVKISKIREIIVRYNSGEIGLKDHFGCHVQDTEIFKDTHCIQDVKDYQLQKAYSALFSLSLTKVESLTQMLNTYSIPLVSAWFFGNLLAI